MASAAVAGAAVAGAAVASSARVSKLPNPIAAATIATIAPNHCCCWAVVDMRTVVDTRKEA